MHAMIVIVMFVGVCGDEHERSSSSWVKQLGHLMLWDLPGCDILDWYAPASVSLSVLSMVIWLHTNSILEKMRVCTMCSSGYANSISPIYFAGGLSLFASGGSPIGLICLAG
jgi:hypothetical protein